MRKSKKWLLAMPMYIFTIVFVACPLLYMVVLSFLTRANVWGVVNEFTLENYLEILKPVYLKTFWQSIQMAFIVTGFTILFGYPFGYFMAKLKGTVKRTVMMLIMIPFWISALIRMYGWIIIFRANGILDQVLMALHMIEKPLRLLYTYPAVIVGMVYVLLPFMIYSVYTSAEKMDWNLIEAARDLGASPIKAFVTITFPLTLPGLLSGIILTFVPSMGLFFVADILGGNKILLIGNVIQEQLMKTRNWPFAAALSVVLMLLTTVLIAIYKKVSKVQQMEGML